VWRIGDLVLWDNLHDTAATLDPSSRRVKHRT
jgi:hypothetical protein